jgi:hypothetical protein
MPLFPRRPHKTPIGTTSASDDPSAITTTHATVNHKRISLYVEEDALVLVDQDKNVLEVRFDQSGVFKKGRVGYYVGL